MSEIIKDKGYELISVECDFDRLNGREIGINTHAMLSKEAKDSFVKDIGGYVLDDIIYDLSHDIADALSRWLSIFDADETALICERDSVFSFTYFISDVETLAENFNWTARTETVFDREISDALSSISDVVRRANKVLEKDISDCFEDFMCDIFDEWVLSRPDASQPKLS